MASLETCGLFFAPRPLIVRKKTAVAIAFAPGSSRRSRSQDGASYLPAAAITRTPQFWFPVSCKKSRRNFSSQNKKQQAKKSSPGHLSLSENLHNGDEIMEVQNATAEGILHSQLEAASNGVAGPSASVQIDAENDDILSSHGSTNLVTEKVHVEDHEQLPSTHPEDLTGMIKNTEKNILLLNEARIRALEDLDRILIEKDGLQAEVVKLEMKLAEMDGWINGAAQEKIHSEYHEDQLVKLNKSFPEQSISGNENDAYEHIRILNSSGSSDVVDLPSLTKELNASREENASLKDDIQMLKDKLSDVKETKERMLFLERERFLLKDAVTKLESKLSAAQEDVSKLATLDMECQGLLAKVENLQMLLDNATKQDGQKIAILKQNEELQRKVDELESSLKEANAYKLSLESAEKYNDLLQQKIEALEEHLRITDEEINSQIELYQASVKEFQDALDSLKEESKKRSLKEAVDYMPWEFWSRLLLILDGWLLEKKISADDAKVLREMAWKRDGRIRDAYIACKAKSEREALAAFLNLMPSQKGSGLHIVHIAAEMAPVAKVGGLGDVVSGLSKALQKRGHLVEIIVPKYDCMRLDLISDLKELDVTVNSYFDGQHFRNKIWVGIVEGLPVYFIEPHHPGKFFWRGHYYGQHDDFKRFSFFSRAALELLFQSGKKPDIIHCHDWQTAFIPPLYWDIYATKGFNSARICFTCHNFEYQGAAPASELASCGLDVDNLNRPDRMKDSSSHDRINPVKGAIVYSNIVTTVSPSYAQEVRMAEGGRGLHEALNFHSRKFFGILNGIDTDAWNPERDNFLQYQYNVDDLQGKADNKVAVRKHLKLSSDNPIQPLVGCITRLVPQKGVHLIRHAIYRTLELGGQFVLLGSSPVPHIQREFEEISNHFQSHPHIRLILSYDEALSHNIYAASDMFVIPSIFEPCGLTQMIAMRYGSVPIVRRTGGLNDSVFDVDDDTISEQLRNGFTFLSPDEQGLSSAMERAFDLYMRKPDIWKELVRKDMRFDFSWDSSSAQYEELYEKSVSRARAVNPA